MPATERLSNPKQAWPPQDGGNLKQRPRSSKARQEIGSSLDNPAALITDVSSIVLEALEEAASLAPVPYLQTASSIALQILTTIQAARDNKAASKHLTNEAYNLIYVVIQAYEGDNRKNSRGMPKSLGSDIQDLLGTLSSIAKFARTSSTRSNLVRLLRYKADARIIQEYRELLKHSLELFALRCDISIRQAIVRIANVGQEPVTTGEILERQLPGKQNRTPHRESGGAVTREPRPSIPSTTGSSQSTTTVYSHTTNTTNTNTGNTTTITAMGSNNVSLAV